MVRLTFNLCLQKYKLFNLCLQKYKLKNYQFNFKCSVLPATNRSIQRWKSQSQTTHPIRESVSRELRK